MVKDYEIFAGRFSAPPIAFGESCARLRNPSGLARPGSMRLRLGEQVFDVGVEQWRSDEIQLAPRIFSGIERFNHQVEHLHHWSYERPD